MRLVLVSLAGMFAFVLLFAGGPLGGASAGLSIAVGAVAVLIALELGTRRLDARRLALLAALAALDAGLRLAVVNGVAGFSPVFFLILCSGYVFGSSFGFLTGALALLASALATGGVGPWLPYEMFACGWMGAIAGLFASKREGRPRRRELALLALLGLVLGYAYGAATDLFDWAVYYRGAPQLGWAPGLPLPLLVATFARFYIATSAVWDSFRAAGDAVMVLALGSPVIAALRRFRARFELTLEQEPAAGWDNRLDLEVRP